MKKLIRLGVSLDHHRLEAFDRLILASCTSASISIIASKCGGSRDERRRPGRGGSPDRDEGVKHGKLTMTTTGTRLH